MNRSRISSSFIWRSDYYASKPYTLQDALLVIEVSDTTVAFDTKRKLPIYASTGVSELWIVNLRNNSLLICREPAEKTYKTQRTLRSGGTTATPALPHVIFKVDDFLAS